MASTKKIIHFSKIKTQENAEKKHFDAFAYNYDSNYGYLTEFTKYKITKKTGHFIDFVKSRYKNKRLKILELGSGTGEYTREVAKLLPTASITGIDISSKITVIAKLKCQKFKNVRFEVKSAYATKYKNESYDVVFGFYVLHHLDSKAVFKEVKRLLKKDGIAYFYEPNILNPVVFAIKHIPYLKRKVGDSPDERALNPLTIVSDAKGFKVIIEMGEFILPINFLQPYILITLDKMSQFIAQIPIIKYLGGSICIKLLKK